MIVQRLAEIYFHNLYILDLFLYCSSFRCALSFSQVRQLQTMTMMALLFMINLYSSNYFYSKAKDGKGYDLYVKH